MKVILSCLLLFLAAVAQAISATGNRLLTIWEDLEDQKLYSKFIGDLESMHKSTGILQLSHHFTKLIVYTGRGYKISHATPKQADLTLEHLGERTYDQIIFFPTKAKGKPHSL